MLCFNLAKYSVFLPALFSIPIFCRDNLYFPNDEDRIAFCLYQCRRWFRSSEKVRNGGMSHALFHRSFFAPFAPIGISPHGTVSNREGTNYELFADT